MAQQPTPLQQRIDFALGGWDRVRTAFDQVGERGSAAFNRIRDSASKVKPAVDQVDTAVNKLQGGMTNVVTLARRLAVALGAVVGVRAIVTTADAFTDMENKIQTATTSAEQYTDVMDKLRAMSNLTRTDVTANAQAFVRFNPVMLRLGKSTDDTIRLLETFNKSLRVSGVSVQEAGAGVRQLAQAFGRGQLRGDEFISVSENLPPVADAISKALGTTRDKLFEFAEAGAITSPIIAEALESMAAEADRNFAKIRVTIGSALQVLRNEFGFFLNDINKATGIGAILSRTILFLADNFKLFGSVITGIGVGLILAFGPRTVTLINALFSIIAKHPFAVLAAAIVAVITYFGQLATGSKGAARIFERLGVLSDLIVAKFNRIGEALTTVANRMAAAFGATGTFENFADVVVGVIDFIIDHFDTLFGVLAAMALAFGAAKLIGAIQFFGTTILGLAAGIRTLNFAISANKIVILVGVAIAAGLALADLARWFFSTAEAADEAGKKIDDAKAKIDKLGDNDDTNDGLDETTDKIKKVKDEAKEPIPPIKIKAEFELPTEGLNTATAAFVKFVEEKKKREKEYRDKVIEYEKEMAEFRKARMDEAQARDEGARASAVKAAEEIAKAAAKVSEEAELKPSILAGWLNWFSKLADGFRALDRAAQKLADSIKAIIGLQKQASGSSGGASGKAAGGPAMARGGAVWGPGSSTSDSILSWLSRGEYVIRAAAVAKYGMRLFHMLNSMRFPADLLKGFNIGGMVDPGRIPRYAAGGLAIAPAAGEATAGLVPWNLTIDTETFEGLLMPEHTASQMIKYSVGKQNASAGNKPWWYR